MKLNVSVFVIVLVIAMTLAAAVFRVSTAGERKRLRLETAKTSCVGSGGTWVVIDSEETCLPTPVPTKI